MRKFVIYRLTKKEAELLGASEVYIAGPVKGEDGERVIIGEKEFKKYPHCMIEADPSLFEGVVMEAALKGELMEPVKRIILDNYGDFVKGFDFFSVEVKKKLGRVVLNSVYMVKV
ncbi:hypothetical protein [Pyrococcus kukulkanii]|uniref:hypothetical protein n=1 Tax=Pyrococcus kukulkanii TaxID=1609559 RepID=UPI003565490C